MSDVAQLLGDTATFDWRGETWTLVPWDRYGIQKMYVAFIKNRAWHAIDPDAGGVSESRYPAAASALTAAIAAGDYDWKGPVWAQSLSRIECIEQLTWLVLRVSHKDLTLATVKEMLAEKGQHISALMEWLVTDPNGRTPAPPTEPASQTPPSSPTSPTRASA